mmetsp:Transcript_25521/g.54448  ORF Transcript_25521/g.54448 Transcript_25521/m.54448 type:complete len:248 (+) Transcript_25521:1608-2351(+)
MGSQPAPPALDNPFAFRGRLAKLRVELFLVLPVNVLARLRGRLAQFLGPRWFLSEPQPELLHRGLGAATAWLSQLQRPGCRIHRCRGRRHRSGLSVVLGRRIEEQPRGAVLGNGHDQGVPHRSLVASGLAIELVDHHVAGVPALDGRVVGERPVAVRLADGVLLVEVRDLDPGPRPEPAGGRQLGQTAQVSRHELLARDAKFAGNLFRRVVFFRNKPFGGCFGQRGPGTTSRGFLFAGCSCFRRPFL